MTPEIRFYAQGEPKGQPEWRPIPSFEGLYEVSSDGRIRRPQCIEKRGNIKPGAEIKRKVRANGYVNVSLCRYGKESTHLVHRLVAIAFLGHSDLQVNHIDGIKAHNDVSNLEYVDARGNYQHAIRTGLAPLGARNGSVTKPENRPRGENNASAKLTSGQVTEIREARRRGETLTSIGLRYGISFRTVHCIEKRQIWKHVP